MLEHHAASQQTAPAEMEARINLAISVRIVGEGMDPGDLDAFLEQHREALTRTVALTVNAAAVPYRESTLGHDVYVDRVTSATVTGITGWEPYDADDTPSDPEVDR